MTISIKKEIIKNIKSFIKTHKAPIRWLKGATIQDKQLWEKQEDSAFFILFLGIIIGIAPQALTFNFSSKLSAFTGLMFLLHLFVLYLSRKNKKAFKR